MPWLVLTSHFVSPNAAINIIRFYTSSSPKLLPFLLARVYQHTSDLELEVSLTCHGRKARLSLRAMVPSPSKKNSGLVNPRWRMYIDFLKKDSIDSRK